MSGVWVDAHIFLILERWKYPVEAVDSFVGIKANPSEKPRQDSTSCFDYKRTILLDSAFRFDILLEFFQFFLTFVYWLVYWIFVSASIFKFTRMSKQLVAVVLTFVFWGCWAIPGITGTPVGELEMGRNFGSPITTNELNCIPTFGKAGKLSPWIDSLILFYLSIHLWLGCILRDQYTFRWGKRHRDVTE